MKDSSIVTAKVEASYGTDALPDPATDADVVFGWTPRPAIYDSVRRSIDRGIPGRRPQAKTRARQGHTFRRELSGGGAADTAAPWGSIWLRGCMFGAPVPTVGSKVTYPLDVDDNGGSLSFYGQKGSGADKMRMRAEGMRGNGKFNFTEGQLPYMEFDWLGLLTNLPDDVAIAAPALPDYPAPIEVNTANTTVTLGGFAVLLRSFELDLGLRPTYRSLVGQRSVIFDSDDAGDRRSAGGTIVCQLPDPTTKSYFANVAAQDELALDLIHGTVAGNIVEIHSTHLVLDEPTFSVENGELMMSCGFGLIPSDAGGDEFTLETK